MEDLNDYRRQIDAIDAQLIPLFEQRMQLSRAVAAYKQTHQLPVLHAGREQQVLDQAEAELHDSSLAPYARRLMREVMELSRAAQHTALVPDPSMLLPSSGIPLPCGAAAYYGAPGSFSEQALIDALGDERERLACPTFEGVFSSIGNGAVVCGVLPIENSSTGSISQVYDLLGGYGFSIIGEQTVGISQNLVGLPDAALNDIRTVYSHEQGIEQSSRFLAQHPNWKTCSGYSTAESAKRVAESGDPTVAAIASRRAASLYGLTLLAPDIQDSRQNTTRFLLIAREPLAAPADKISVAFSLDHESGTLYNVLRHFSEGHINMVKIESRPIPDVLWHYCFYLDFEGDPTAPPIKALLESLATETRDFRMLGAYRSCTHSRL